ERRDGRAAHVAGRHRPRGAGRPVLRSRRHRRAARAPEARAVQQAVARRGPAAPAVGGVGGIDRRHVSGLMRSVEDHARVVAGLIRARPAVTVALADAAGLALASDVVAPLSLPSFDNSAMDGYAVVVDDVAGATDENPVVLPVAEDIPAGRTDTL